MLPGVALLYLPTVSNEHVATLRSRFLLAFQVKNTSCKAYFIFYQGKHCWVGVIRVRPEADYTHQYTIYFFLYSYI